MTSQPPPDDRSTLPEQPIPPPNGESLFALLTYLPRKDIDTVRTAFELAKKEHDGMYRKSKEHFICHPLTIAEYLAEYHADAPTLIAALLHDVAEDVEHVTIKHLEAKFGKEVGRLVDGVTKFDNVTGEAMLGRELNRQELNTATHFKLFETMKKDVRVGIVKIFDRLHNMRTISPIPFRKQEEKARETMRVYAPLADRLGMWQIKNELETISLGLLYPTRFRHFLDAVDKRKAQNHADFPDLSKDIRQVIDDADIEMIQVVEAPIDVSDSFRIFREEQETYISSAPPNVVLLLKNEIDCYKALGYVHAAWRPVPGKFDDYIGATRHNLYRSLHTMVIYKGRRVKVRIRTVEMQVESQMGVLSRWTNTQTMPIWDDSNGDKFDRLLNRLQESDEDAEGEEFDDKVQHILDDVFNAKLITVFTPKGDPQELPRGATPVDFAYKIHTEVGNACRGALVNSERKPLTHELQDGDSVFIEMELDQTLEADSEEGVKAKANPHPQFAWLDPELGYIRTRQGYKRVRKWFKKLPESMACQIGRLLAQRELKILDKKSMSFDELCTRLTCKTPDELFLRLGRGELNVSEFSTELLKTIWKDEDEAADLEFSSDYSSSQAVLAPTGEVYVIEYSGDREMSLCQTCNPRPGHVITGGISRHDRVVVHVRGCVALTPEQNQQGRLLKLRWGTEGPKDNRPVTMLVYAHDRDGLIHDISGMFEGEQVNINFLWSITENHRALILFSAVVSEASQVVRFLHKAHDLENVIHAGYMGQTVSEQVMPEQFFDENGEWDFGGLDKRFGS